MNREIKFRCWTSRLKSMVQIDQITFIEAGWSLEKGNGISIPAQPDRVLMQFTGLKDTSEKDIYEGDILKRSNGEIGVVKYREDLACFDFVQPKAFYSILLGHARSTLK